MLAGLLEPPLEKASNELFDVVDLNRSEAEEFETTGLVLELEEDGTGRESNVEASFDFENKSAAAVKLAAFTGAAVWLSVIVPFEVGIFDPPNKLAAL